ncbi:MAG: hypothetical protein LUG49_03265 [Oscillospiraceae bacterium]|nr:hypothetical protein [Oscillospiraceae bacterium]
MIITIVSTLMLMLGYFLMLYGAVGFIQDKRFFFSAPKENLAVIPDRKERFKGAHVIGWGILLIAVLLFISAFALAIWDGARNRFGALRFFLRFITMLYAMEIYDIFFFDWYLLCRSNFFIHFYPELKSVDRSRFFGYNKKEHIMHFLIYIPVCAVLALGCGAIFGGIL